MKKAHHKILLAVVLLLLCFVNTGAQTIVSTKTVFVDSGWANNSVNTVVFRKNALCTFRNTQYISFYNKDGMVVLGKRNVAAAKWELVVTRFKGDVTDAHRTISIMTDGDGYLHMAWNHHVNVLHYSKSKTPGSLQMMDEMPMTGIAETKVTYPEFYYLPNGNLLFLYRDGSSGNGNLVIDSYNTREQKWHQLHSNLIDGEKQRNAYWQACVDAAGTIHLSWVWRESPDVASNHDMCYAQSNDGGVTWQNSKKEKYVLPITAATAEYVCRIPQKSELINQTSMCASEDGHPYIASYWKDANDSVPQFHVMYNNGKGWIIVNTGFRRSNFSISGTGTKRIPISRPQIARLKKGSKDAVVLIFRDEERGNVVSAAINSDIHFNNWQITNLTGYSAGSWEPCYDTELWKQKKQLHLIVQYTDQQDAEGKANLLPQPVSVLEIKMR